VWSGDNLVKTTGVESNSIRRDCSATMSPCNCHASQISCVLFPRDRKDKITLPRPSTGPCLMLDHEKEAKQSRSAPRASRYVFIESVNFGLPTTIVRCQSRFESEPLNSTKRTSLRWVTERPDNLTRNTGNPNAKYRHYDVSFFESC
jgi:hypothetical protein